MNVWPETLFPLIARAAVMMFVTMLMIRGLLWLLKIRSPEIYRWSSVLVLVQGWIVAPLVISIPWYDPLPVRPHANVEMARVKAFEAPAAARHQGTEPNNAAEAIRERRVQRISASFVFRLLTNRLGTLLQLSWLVGMFVLVIAVVLNYVRHGLAARNHYAVDENTSSQWQSLLHLTGGPAKLPLRLTQAIGPLLCLLPRGYEVWIPRCFWQSCSTAEQEAILRHELSHYRRGDIWKTWLMYALALPQWFNPAAWWALRNFQQAGEWMCDREAAESLPERTDYLRTLLRLVELQPSQQSLSNTVAGQCAHAHPLLVRVRRLVSSAPCQDSFMNKLLYAVAVLGITLLPLVRLQLVARAADPPAALVAVKDKMAELDGKLAQVKEGLESLKERGAQLKEKIEPKAHELTKLAEDPSQLSDELKANAKTFMGGDEKTQLEVVKDLGKLASQDEQILALGRVVKDSPHESVRRLAIQQVLAKGDAGYPAIALSFENLSNKDRSFLALELNKIKNDDKLFLFLAMAKNADDELIATLIGLDLPINQKLLIIGGLADSRKDDEKFAEQVVSQGDKAAGDDGLVILYAIAKTASPKNAIAAVKSAVKRKAEAWPVIAAAYKKEDRDCRTAVVRAAKELGGEGGDFLVKTALADPNADLRAAAEDAVK